MRSLLRVGTRKPGPPNDCAAPISARRSSLVAFAVAEKSDRRRVTGDAAGALDHRGIAGPQRIAHFARAVMAVDAHAEAGALVEIARLRRPHRASGNGNVERGALKRAQRLARVEAKRGVETE